MTEPRIHPTAIVDPKSELAADVIVGPYAIIEGGVRIDAGTRIGPHVHLRGETRIGRDNEIYTGCTLGFPPQHLAYAGGPTRLTIGDGNRIREYANIHGSFEEGGCTTLGNRCFIMGFSHIGHDCRVEDEVVIANGVLLSGHVDVGKRAFISGNAAAHQFCRIGKLAMVSGFSQVLLDVPPFVLVQGTPTRIRALNSVGLRRAGIAPEARSDLKRVFRELYRSGVPALQAVRSLDHGAFGPEATEILDFYTSSRRGVLGYERYRSGYRGDTEMDSSAEE